MSAEAWVGLAAAVLALMTAVGTGLVIWMGRVHWMLAGIKQELVQINGKSDKDDTKLDRMASDIQRLLNEIHKLKIRIALLEGTRRLAGGKTLHNIAPVQLPEEIETSEDSDDKEV